MLNLVVILSACNKFDEPTQINGKITNGISGEPIEDVLISVNEYTGGVFDTTPYPDNPTDTSGISNNDVTFSLNIASSESAEKYFISFSKENYCSRFTDVRAGQNHQLEIL